MRLMEADIFLNYQEMLRNALSRSEKAIKVDINRLGASNRSDWKLIFF